MKKFRTLLLLTLSLAIVTTTNSCKKDDDPDDGIVNFASASIDRTTDDLSDITVSLTIDPPAPQASEIKVAITGAEEGTVFTTTPAMSGGEVTISVAKDATSASFTVSPIEEGIGFDDVQLTLTLSSVGEGLTTGLTTSSQINIANAKDTGEPLPFVETFSICSDTTLSDSAQNAGIPPEDWTQVVAEQNAEESAVWKCIPEFFGVTGVQVNAFVPGSDDQSSSEVWLVSPRIDLLDATAPVLNFEVDRRFPGTGNFPEDLYDILISTDYTGLNFATATWTRFQAGFDAMTDNDPGQDNLASTGDLDLSDYNGNVIAIAFVYRAGAPASFDATILRIGEVSITD